jgi:hypothetical protein
MLLHLGVICKSSPKPLRELQTINSSKSFRRDPPNPPDYPPPVPLKKGEARGINV